MVKWRRRFEAPEIDLAPGREPRTIDMTRRGWGHDVMIWSSDYGMTQRGTMHVTPGPAVGDYVIFSTGNREKPTTRYRLTRVKWLIDPTDQYAVSLEFAPR